MPGIEDFVAFREIRHRRGVPGPELPTTRQHRARHRSRSRVVPVTNSGVQVTVNP